MSGLNGIYVDINGDIKCRLGDSGSITVIDIPTDDDYKVSFAVINPVGMKILQEVSVQSNNQEEVEIEIPVSFTTSLGVGKFFYGIKLTDSEGKEQTVMPMAYEDEDGNVGINNPNTFVVKPLLVEGGITNA